jgi:hypothetical protein
MIARTRPAGSRLRRSAASASLATLALFPALALVASAHAQSAPAPAAAAAPASSAGDSLRSVAFLEGGTWLGEGTWPDGSKLRVEQRFFWGPTRTVLHFESYDLASGERRLLYEGLLFFDPKRGRVVQWNFKPNGERDETEVTRMLSDGYEIRGAKTWSLVRGRGADEFTWELRVPQGNDWREILRATYRRRR